MENLNLEKEFIRYSNIFIPDFENNKNFKIDIDSFLKEEMKTRTIAAPEAQGRALSSVSSKNKLFNFPWFYNFIIHLSPYIENSMNFFNLEGKNLKIKRAWVNKIFKGCKGTNHSHGVDNCDLVCIYYYSSPENSSQLILNNFKFFNVTDDLIPEELKYYIKVKTGDLVVHRPGTFHAVSEHKSDEPRICFVVELKIEK